MIVDQLRFRIIRCIWDYTIQRHISDSEGTYVIILLGHDFCAIIFDIDWPIYFRYCHTTSIDKLLSITIYYWFVLPIRHYRTKNYSRDIRWK